MKMASEGHGSSSFQWQDYLVFCLSYLANIVVGVVFAVKDKWGQQSTESYLMGDRRMPWFTTGISISVSLINAIFVVGFTSEMYYTGIQICLIMVYMFTGSALVALIVVPKYFRLGRKITSTYEYYEMRFNRPVRIFSSSIYIIGMMLYMSVVLFAPCSTLSRVSNIDIRLCILFASVVCSIYTGLGGLKAVVFVDNMQFGIMVVGLVALAIKGTLDAGGIEHVWTVYKASGRVDFDTQATLWDRHNIWNLCFAATVGSFLNKGAKQMVVQRILSVPKMRHAVWATMFIPMLTPVLVLLMFLTAAPAFALLGGDDPLLTGEINNPIEMFPYYMMKIFGNMPGLPGLLVAATFAAALSTLSSGQNALASLVLQDLVKPSYQKIYGRDLREDLAAKICRCFGLGLGLPIMGLSLLVLKADDMLYSLARSVESFTIAPLGVLLISAMFFPFIEPWGVVTGMVCALLWGMHQYLGAMFIGSSIGYDRPPLYRRNFTEQVFITVDPEIKPTIYDWSYTLYVPSDIVVGLVAASIVSVIVLSVKHRKNLKLNKDAKWSDSITWREHTYSKEDFLSVLRLVKPQKKVKDPPTSDVNSYKVVEDIVSSV